MTHTCRDVHTRPPPSLCLSLPPHISPDYKHTHTERDLLFSRRRRLSVLVWGCVEGLGETKSFNLSQSANGSHLEPRWPGLFSLCLQLVKCWQDPELPGMNSNLCMHIQSPRINMHHRHYVCVFLPLNFIRKANKLMEMEGKFSHSHSLLNK